MHGDQGRDGQELWGDDAEHRKSWGLCGMSQHSLRVLQDVTNQAEAEAKLVRRAPHLQHHASDCGWWPYKKGSPCLMPFGGLDR